MSKKPQSDQKWSYLLIKLQGIQFRTPQTLKNSPIVYFSFSIQKTMYFSSCLDQKSSTLTDDIIIPLDEQLPRQIQLSRWQNHMIMFSYVIDINQLKSRPSLKKKHQTKPGEILSFMIFKLNDEELKFGDKYIESISQHYFIFEQMLLSDNQTKDRADVGPSYYIIKTSTSDYVMPVSNGEICIKLPEETLQFQHIRNGQSAGKSKKYTSKQINKANTQIQLKAQGYNTYLGLTVKWGINFYRTKAQDTLLFETHEIMIYDMEVKFDSSTHNQYVNSKVKFVYGSKAYEIGNQFVVKSQKIKKIVHFIIKSEDQQVGIIVQKNGKVVGQSKFYTKQISPYMVHFPKRKLMADNEKEIGFIKFKCQKAKNLSTPGNNLFWKQVQKSALHNRARLEITQMSVLYQINDPIDISIKTFQQEKKFENVQNLEYYEYKPQNQQQRLIMQTKHDDNIYLLINESQQSKRSSSKGNDFIGMAMINFQELRLGLNCVQVNFVKGQINIGKCYCLINNVNSYPIINPSNLSLRVENLSLGAIKTMALTIFMKKVTFSPYFHTFSYQNKNEVYCIVQVNKNKKVLIMQSTIHDELTLVPSTSSDSLGFHIGDVDYITVKIVFLVSDVGQEQEIYGSSIVKIKIGQLNAAISGIPFNVKLKNQIGTDVGFINLQVHKGIQASPPRKQIEIMTGPFKSDIKRVQNDLNKIHQNMEIMERSVKKKSLSPKLQRLRKSVEIRQDPPKSKARYDNAVNYGNNKRRQRNNYSVVGVQNQSIKLPHIKQNRKKQSNLRDLVDQLKIRKRDPRGHFQQNFNIQQYQPKKPASQRDQYIMNNRSQQYDPPFHTQKGSRQNQSIERDFQIPQKKKKKQKEDVQNQILQYEKKLQELKRIKNQMKLDDEPEENQAGQIPLFSNNKIRNTRQSFRRGQRVQQPQQNLEFEDNQFFRPQN